MKRHDKNPKPNWGTLLQALASGACLVQDRMFFLEQADGSREYVLTETLTAMVLYGYITPHGELTEKTWRWLKRQVVE